jgi:hypothetical protein
MQFFTASEISLRKNSLMMQQSSQKGAIDPSSCAIKRLSKLVAFQVALLLVFIFLLYANV